jgi:hypothetical protein
MYDTLLKNICNGLGIRCMSNDCITALITSLYRNEMDLKHPHKSVVTLNNYIQANGIDAELFELIIKLKADEQIENDEYNRLHPIDFSLLDRSPPLQRRTKNRITSPPSPL